MATIAATDLKRAGFPVSALYTLGSPRLGISIYLHRSTYCPSLVDVNAVTR